MKRDAEAEAADLRLSASGRIGPSQQVNTPTITTTTTDVCGSTSDPVKEGEKERGIQNDGEFNLEDEDNGLKSSGIPPAINYAAGSKDSLKDHETDQNDTYTSNEETTGPERNDNDMITKGDELKEGDHLETENKRVPFWRKLIAYRPWKSEPSSTSDLERKGIFSCGCRDCCKSCLFCCFHCSHTIGGYLKELFGRAEPEPYGEARMTKAQPSRLLIPNPGITKTRVTIDQPPPPPPTL